MGEENQEKHQKKRPQQMPKIARRTVHKLIASQEGQPDPGYEISVNLGAFFSLKANQFSTPSPWGKIHLLTSLSPLSPFLCELKKQAFGFTALCSSISAVVVVVGSTRAPLWHAN